MGINRRATSVDGQFVTMPNSWARDDRLSHRARGILLTIMSHRIGWHITIKSLVDGGLEGRDAISAAMQELIFLGYLQRSQGHDEQGRFTEVDYDVCDPYYDSGVPLDDADLTVDGFTGNGSPADGSPADGKSATKKTISKKTISQKTNTPQREAQKHATRITEDWLPSEAQREKTLEEYGKTHDIQRELASFRDHWMAAAGQNARKLDWDATWRNWMRRANPRPGFSPTKAAAPQSGKVIMSKAERNLAQMDPEYLRRIGVDPTPGGGVAVAQQEIVGGVAGGPIVVEVLGEQGRVQQTFHSHRGQQGITS